MTAWRHEIRGWVDSSEMVIELAWYSATRNSASLLLQSPEARGSPSYALLTSSHAEHDESHLARHLCLAKIEGQE